MVSRLKSLEMQGYKTFASKTLFEFSGDVTAVVGPNGSGKSNIADSIRWVLGEQAYSLLRGKKTEDMIFAGSESRSRASMASATITFNNEDGWLPIDYSEVALTRRAYRDGQNEYFLNNQRVRLREFNELLAQSGLAERTYTIIGQGLVDTALAAKPDERRKFFEEAAGIGLYRSRREESLGRLEKTRRNLERAQDILSELSPRLRSLERQAQRAREYNQIKEDLQILLRDWYGYHWHRKLEDLKQSKQMYKQQEQSLEKARLSQTEIEQKISQIRTQLQSLRSELNQWHAQSAEFHQQHEKSSRRFAVIDERQRAISEQMQNIQADLVRLEEEQQARLEKRQNLIEEQASLQADLKDANTRLEEARRKFQDRLAEKRKAESELGSTRQEKTNYETQKVRLTAQLNEINGRIEESLNSRNKLEETLKKQDKELDSVEEQLAWLENTRDKLEGEVQEAERQLKEQQAGLDQLNIKRRELLENKGKLEAEKSGVKARLEVLQQAEKSFSGLNQGARFILEAAKSGKIRGQYRAVSNFLDVSPEYEFAIAAVLGNYLDAVMIDSDAEVESVLQLLEKGENGRAVIVPSTIENKAQSEKLLSFDGVIGCASDFVTVPDEYHPLINTLLGRVVLVKDRKTALSVRKQLGEDIQLVTLQGEVFVGNGVVIAGRDGRAGVISRPRQKRELQARISELENIILQTNEALEQIDLDFQRFHKKVDQYQLQVKDLSKKLKDASRDAQQENMRFEQIRQNSAWQKNQLANLTAQSEQFEKKKQDISQQIEKVDLLIEQLNIKIKDQKNALYLLPSDEFQAQVTHWQTTAAVAAGAARESEKRLVEIESTVDSNQLRKKSLEQRISGIEKELEGIELEKQNLRAQEGGVSKEIESLQEKIDPSERMLEKLDQEYLKMQEEQSQTQQQLSIAERHSAQAQIEFTKQRDALETLRDKIQEDFGLVAFEYTSNVTGPTPLPFGSMVNQLPALTEIPKELEVNIREMRGQLRRLGAVNPEAESEYESVKQRHEFLTNQLEDLKKADEDLRSVIAELDELMKKEFKKTFDAVAIEFRQMFTQLFGGGSARLVLMDEDNPAETGIDIEAKLPGRRKQGLSLLSGGERSLTAVALIFALLKVSPTPFCVLDEVDAALDEANVGRFTELLRELSNDTQFIVITHNRNTVQISDVIYGVTMGRDSASQVISLKLDEISEDMVH